MKRLAWLAATVAALATTTAGWAPASASVEQLAHSTGPAAIKAVVVKSGLANPAGFAFLPDGRIIYGERNTGRIVILDPKSGEQTVVYTIPDIRSSGEQGLLGLAVDPKFPKKPLIYAYATRQVNTLQNQILKIKMDGDKGISRKVIWRLDTVAGTYHDGGHMDFGPDNKLYVVVGEGHSSGRAQDLTTDAGKLLRMNRNGSAPDDNPIDGSRIFTYGLRNSFGFAFDPMSGTLWETENGPECVDEINVEKAGENHAWGSHETCQGTPPENVNQDGPEPRIMPLTWFTPTIAPTGLAFCNGCGIKSAKKALFFGAANTGEIRKINLTADRQGIVAVSVVFDSASPVFSMQRAPNGKVYFSTQDTIYKLAEG